MNADLTLVIDPDEPTPAPAQPTARQRITAGLHAARIIAPAGLRDPGNWAAGVFITVALTAAGGVLWLLYLTVVAIGDGLDTAAHATGNGLFAAWHWFTRGPITHAINDPVRAYLDAHTTGLPATGDDLWILWLVTTGLLYLAALFGSTYARIGWAAIGALTAAAAWHGTTTATTRPTAAAVTAAVWLLLSLLAYARAMYAARARTTMTAAMYRDLLRRPAPARDTDLADGA